MNKFTILSGLVLISVLFSFPAKAGGVFGTTTASVEKISSCIVREIKKFNNVNYTIKNNPEDSTTEYIINFDDKKGTYRFILKDWKNSRILTLFYPNKTERKDRFLNHIIVDCTE